MTYPPVALTNKAYLPTVAITAAVTFYFSGWLSRLTGLLVVLDAVTLGFFTVIGAQKAELAGLPSASVVFIGTLTAVGGAVIRDVLLAQRADIVQPGPYNAVAALIGATALTVLSGPVGLGPAAGRRRSHRAGRRATGAVGLARLVGAGRRRPARPHPRPAGPPPAPAVAQASVPASGVTSGTGSMLGGTIWRPASAGRGSSCGCSRTASIATSSWASGRNSRLSTSSQRSSSGRPAHSLSTSTNSAIPDVEVAVAPLDQAVGVQQHRRARVQDGHVLPALGRGRDAEQQLRLLAVQEHGLAVGGQHGRGRMARAGPAHTDPPRPQVVLVLLEPGDERGGHRVQRQTLDGPVEPGQHLGRRAATGIADATQQAAHLAHRRGGAGVVAHDVADRDHRRAVGLQEGVVPVAADLGPGAAGT